VAYFEGWYLTFQPNHIINRNNKEKTFTPLIFYIIL
jgi:hypothetical protein